MGVSVQVLGTEPLTVNGNELGVPALPPLVHEAGIGGMPSNCSA